MYGRGVGVDSTLGGHMTSPILLLLRSVVNIGKRSPTSGKTKIKKAIFEKKKNSRTAVFKFRIG